MKYEDLKRDNTVYHCIINNAVHYLFRFIEGDRKQIINYHTHGCFNNCIAFRGGDMNKYRLANLEEQCRFYNEFGYKDAKGRVWKVGDNDSHGCEIMEFETGSKSKTIWTKSKYPGSGVLWGSTCLLDRCGDESPLRKLFSESTQESLDIVNELAKSGYMTIDQCRESLNSTKPEKVHWFKRFIRRIV